jgi:hypothetical protein
MAMEMLLELTFMAFAGGRRKILVEEGDPILLEAAQAIQVFLTDAMNIGPIDLPGLLPAPVTGQQLIITNGPAWVSL